VPPAWQLCAVRLSVLWLLLQGNAGASSVSLSVLAAASRSPMLELLLLSRRLLLLSLLHLQELL